MECLRFEVGVEAIEVRRMNGVRPEEADSVSSSGPESENRTRFLVRFGVAGGVDIPWGREIARSIFDECACIRALGPMLVLRCLRTAIGLSSLTIRSYRWWSAIAAIMAG